MTARYAITALLASLAAGSAWGITAATFGLHFWPGAMIAALIAVVAHAVIQFLEDWG